MSQGPGRAADSGAGAGAGAGAGPGLGLGSGGGAGAAPESSVPGSKALLENREHLSAEDAARVLREVLAGERRTKPGGRGRPLNTVAVGEWSVQAGDAAIVIFVDDASLAHLVTMRLGDGRTGDFEAWFARDSVNPLELLEEDERLALEQRLREAV